MLNSFLKCSIPLFAVGVFALLGVRADYQFVCEKPFMSYDVRWTCSEEDCYLDGAGKEADVRDSFVAYQNASPQVQKWLKNLNLISGLSLDLFDFKSWVFFKEELFGQLEKWPQAVQDGVAEFQFGKLRIREDTTTEDASVMVKKDGVYEPLLPMSVPEDDSSTRYWQAAQVLPDIYDAKYQTFYVMYRADVIKEENSSTHYRYELDRYVLAACELKHIDTQHLLQEEIDENLQELKKDLSYFETKEEQMKYIDSFLDVIELYKKYGVEKVLPTANVASYLFPRSFTKQSKEFQQGIYDYVRTGFEQLKSNLPPLFIEEQPVLAVDTLQDNE